MAARPSSPTSLLWAHQLKREHGHLLKRMQELEANSERQAKQIKTAETAAQSQSQTDLAALAKKIKALDQSGVASRLSKIEHSLREKAEELEAGMEAITIQIAAMKKDTESRDEEKRKAFTKEKTLLKRIGDIETGLKRYEDSLDKMGRRVDDDRMEQIKSQLKDLTRQVEKEGGKMQLLEASIAALEGANGDLMNANARLMTEMQKAAAVAKDGAGASENDDSSSAVPVAPQQGRKERLSHGWKGRGTEKDIIASGVHILGDKVLRLPARKTTKNADVQDDNETPSRKRIGFPPKWKPKPKPIPPHLHPSPPMDASPRPKKSHKWSGGGTEKGILRTGNALLEDAGTHGQAAGVTLAQRPQHQPKKRNATPHWTATEAWTQGRTTRGQQQAAGDASTQATQAMPQAQTKTKARPKQTGNHALGSDLTTVAPPPRAQPEPQGHPAPARKRRRILQND